MAKVDSPKSLRLLPIDARVAEFDRAGNFQNRVKFRETVFTETRSGLEIRLLKNRKVLRPRLGPNLRTKPQKTLHKSQTKSHRGTHRLKKPIRIKRLVRGSRASTEIRRRTTFRQNGRDEQGQIPNAPGTESGGAQRRTRQPRVNG